MHGSFTKTVYAVFAFIGEKLRALLYQNDMCMANVEIQILRESIQELRVETCKVLCTVMRAMQENKDSLKGGWYTEFGLANPKGWNEPAPQVLLVSH